LANRKVKSFSNVPVEQFFYVALTSIEICAGAGGQALGLEQAGFTHEALVEIEPLACNTLLLNRNEWNVIRGDVKDFSALAYGGIDLLAGGVPCPPFSIAGKQLGPNDDRDLFPEALRLVEECLPNAILLENVRGLLDDRFKTYRNEITARLVDMGYVAEWRLLNASDFGVSQLRPRAILVGLREEFVPNFSWPKPNRFAPLTVGQLLYDEMASLGWEGVDEWARKADAIGPTLVGGSKRHGGPDLGPTRARQAWAKLGVDGLGIADFPPQKEFVGMPRLTLSMTALLQGFPASWHFAGKKTGAYRQIGNAFPPPVARAVGQAIAKAITSVTSAMTVNEVKEVQRRAA